MRSPTCGRLADRNRVLTSMIGMGYSDTHTPGVILRNVLENPAWYTAYTPYQPEISQGRLEALLNFQTMVVGPHRHGHRQRLDARRGHRGGRGDDDGPPRLARSSPTAFFVDADCHPQTIEVVADPGRARSASRWSSAPTDEPRPARRLRRAAGLPGIERRGPRPLGHRRDRSAARGAFVAVATDLLALLPRSRPRASGAPTRWSARPSDSACPMGFGGPHAGFLATRDATRRSLPGRLVGVSVDAAGRPAYRLALQTREQHIRREKATSNICTAQVLLAVIASMYAVYHGPDGLAAHRHAACSGSPRRSPPACGAAASTS